MRSKAMPKAKPEEVLDAWQMKMYPGKSRMKGRFVGGAGPVLMLRAHETDPKQWRYELRTANGDLKVAGAMPGAPDAVVRWVLETFKQRRG